MSSRKGLKSEMKEYYEQSKLPPYLLAASQPAAAAHSERMDRSTSEAHLNEVGTVGEADAAAGSMLTRVRSLGRLRSPSAHTVSVHSAPEHQVAEEPPSEQEKPKIKPSWHLKDKMRTAGVGLVMALNIGTDPPDVTKPHPCAKMQTWFDPTSLSRAKATERIGERLQAQYAQWQQQRTAAPLKYRRTMDPTMEDVRGLCLWLRRKAGIDRVLLHYNGHGVPRPTSSGELWLFDKNKTQYIPLCITDLRQWMGKPNIVVLDCSCAGVLMPFLTAPLESNGDATPPLTNSEAASDDATAASSQWVSDTIVLCPTSENEWLPMHPEYPADIFTSCLTTPIQMALRWFVRRNPQSMGDLSPEAVDSIPGKAGDRKTPLGELTWIFAAVTDSIAWNVLPRPLFQRLFRQDLLVAGMFRNFLLADRILRSLNCSPQSYPPLPSGVCDHPLWEAWDLACETCLHGLMRDGILTNRIPVSPSADDDESPEKAPTPVAKPVATTTGPASSVSSPFFSEQLDAFEIWLDFASIHTTLDTLEPFETPEQLPIVLQVLLTPAYRVRALKLFRRFLDLGPYAVNVTLSLGILPYVTKLLHSPEYKLDLMAIWAKILAFDPSCQQVVLKDGGLPHFISHLTWGISTASIAIAVDPKEAASQRTMAAFVLAVTCLDFPRAQAECIRLNLHGTCCSLLSSLEVGSEAELDPQIEAKLSIAESRVPLAFRTWLCICLGNLAKDNHLAQDQAFGAGVHRRLLSRISDDSPEVSAAACYALGCMLGKTRQNSRSSSRQDLQQQPSVSITAGSGQPGLISNRLIASSNTPMGAARLQPSFTSGQPLGIMPLRSAQFPQGHPRVQQPGFNPTVTGAPGAGMVPTAFGGRPMDNRSLLEQSQGPLSPQFAQNATGGRQRAPSVFTDEIRIAYDVSVAEGLLKATEDASAVVRYEAVVALSRLVEKYLDAFVAIADSLNMHSESQKQAPVSGSETQERLASLLLESMGGGDEIAMPDGLDDSVAARFAEVWRVLRFLQRHDPYPDVASAAVSVVSFVNEHILRLKMKQVGKGDDEDGGGSREESSGLRPLLSMPSISDQLQQDSGLPAEGALGGLQQRSDSKDKSTPLRRVASVTQSIAPPEMLSNRSKSEGKVSHELQFNIDYDLPVSTFFEWQRDLFADLSTDCLNVEGQPADPLSFKGAVNSYREQRNRRVGQASRKYTDHFATLAPKPPQPKKKQRFNIDLSDEEEDEAAIEADAKKKRELELKQKNCVKNDGAEMSCLLKFHAYEDSLCVCDGHDGISVWDARKSSWASMFRNGNPKGSRMTSATWVNEMSNSLFLVGCDDGSVRIWDGLIEPNGRASRKNPSLSAAFFAAPGMVAGSSSGLILDWQQYSGRLLAGGSSNQIRCWDLNVEKCASVIETESNECVTTITTAWRYDPYGVGSTPEGFRGIGPDTIVVGHGDGTIRLFDIRVKRRVAEMQSSKGRATRRPRTTRYDEHGSWIVSTCLTGYSSRPEIVSGSVDGEIKTWDLRLSSSLRTYTAQRRPMTAMSVHPSIPMLATASIAQFIKVMTLDGDTLQVIRYHEAMSGHRIGPVSCLEFHPHKPLLAAGGTDSIVSIYSPKTGMSSE